MPPRLVALLACTISAATLAASQAETPALSRQQRTTLQSLVRAVENRSADTTVAESDWPLHVLRASDGSHYVAFSITRAPDLRIDRPVALYVRLATRPASNQSPTPERSAVAEWLAGQTPTPALPRRGLAFGEMPVYGPAGIAQRGAGQQAQNLQLLELERERAREKREEQERARKAALEGEEMARGARPLLPFEDFDFAARAVVDANGAPVLRRSLTTGPGEYELVVAWADANTNSAESVHVARRSISLPPASTTGLALSSVIVADDVSVRDEPVAPTEQASRPYSIGGTEITPASDQVLTPEERLALLVQVINARGNAAGKPDVAVGFRIFRQTNTREENIGSLAPQSYNELTLPLDFDVAKGHPLFAAVAIPLRTFKRGEYRVEITANDRIAGVGVTTDTLFTVTATPAALLVEAPPLVAPFNPSREALTTDVAVIRGGVHASDGNDREAFATWKTALDAGVAPAVVRPLMIDAALRLGDLAAATTLAREGLAATPNNPRYVRQLAITLIRSAKRDEALSLLDDHLRRAPDDIDAQWLALHALFADFVAGEGVGATDEGRTRFSQLARQYVEAKGPNAALALDWASVVR
jgi:hypothetical protein